MGFCDVEVVIDDGPLQVYLLVLAPGVAVSVTVPPEQTGPLFTGAAEGIALTVTDVLARTVLLQPVPGYVTVKL